MHSLRRVLLRTLSFAIMGIAPLVAQQTVSTTPSGAPAKMRLCVDGSCEALIWRGSYYDGVKEKGSDISTHYTVSQWSAQGVRLEGKTINPVSQSATQLPGGFRIPTKTYMEATFAGSMSADGNSVDNGVVNWKMGKVTGEKVFTLTWETASPAAVASEACPGGLTKMPPFSAMLVCDGYCIATGSHDLSTWIFSGSKGIANWTGGSKASLTIQEWSEGKLVISREDAPDSNTAGVSAVYRGSVCGDTIKGTFNVRWPGHPEDKAQGSWTATIPITSCDGVANDTLQLIQVAHTAIQFRQPPSAFSCLARAADLGDRDARTATGIMYRDGIGTKVSYPDALRFLKQSAIQGDYNAQLALSQFYDIGVGVPTDPAEAKHWRDIAFNNPLAVQARANKQAADDMRKMTFLGLTAMVEAMATPTVYVRQSLF